MIWICPGDSARGMLRVARREIAPTLPVDRIVSVGRDFSRGNLVSQKDYGFPEDGEAVVWYGDSAPERCAMLYAVNRLHARHRPVTLVHVGCMHGIDRSHWCMSIACPLRKCRLRIRRGASSGCSPRIR